MDQQYANVEELFIDCTDAYRKKIQTSVPDRSAPPLSGGAFSKRTGCKTTTVLLCLLCCLLLIGFLTLAVLFTRGSSQWETERVLLSNSYNNLTTELNCLQTKYNDLTEDRDRLQKELERISEERNDLQMKNQVLQREWIYVHGSFYYVSPNMLSWHESRADCLRRGADLMIINSGEEQEFARSFQGQIWIGLTDEGAEGNWKWVDGTPLNNSYWGPGEPNGSPQKDEDCVQFRKYGSQYSWNDEPCDRKNRWICEKKSTPRVG